MNVFLIGRHKFGSNIDYLNWYNLLTNQGYKIKYLCIGIVEGYNANANVKVFEGKWNRIGIIKFVKWCSLIINLSKDSNIVVIVKAFPGMSILLLSLMFNRNIKFVSDIRSQSVSKKYRSLLNFLLYFESMFFNFKTAINLNVGKKIFKSDRFFVIPLAADSSFLNARRVKKNEIVNFLYVGTFYQRNIIQLVNAFLSSKTSYSKKLTLIGGNDIFVEDKLIEISKKHSEEIEYLGYLPNTELVSHFENADIGISWVPLTDFFDWQPPTKILEYLMAGMPVLATRTSASKEIIDDTVGWLIEDTYKELVYFLESLNVENLPSSHICRERVINKTWENVVKTDLIPILHNIAYNEL